jgi:phosphoserine aminotransferase
MVHNFNAGPSLLPREVYEEAAGAILNYQQTGMSILEIGHRTVMIESMLEETIQLAKDLMKLDDNHEVLFLHGGATTQFFQVPMNLLNEDQTAAYLDCGVWGTKAIKEAKNFGHVQVVASSKDRNYTYIPKGFKIPEDAAYFHYTTNNTIEGTEMFSIPDTHIPLIADMSSDILSREMDFNRFALIYAGAQKNIGATGVNMVVVQKDILGKVNRKLPGMMDYRQHIDNRSMLNTPPVFAIYVCLLTLRWLKKKGGVAAIEKINIEKANLLYKILEEKEGFDPTVVKEDRSRMNVVFLIKDPSLEKKFLDACQDQQMVGIQGHRSVGGFRISLYNALPIESVEAITRLIEQL